MHSPRIRQPTQESSPTATIMSCLWRTTTSCRQRSWTTGWCDGGPCRAGTSASGLRKPGLAPGRSVLWGDAAGDVKPWPRNPAGWQTDNRPTAHSNLVTRNSPRFAFMLPTDATTAAKNARLKRQTFASAGSITSVGDRTKRCDLCGGGTDGCGCSDHHHGRHWPWAGLARGGARQAARAHGLRLVGPNCLVPSRLTATSASDRVRRARRRRTD